MKEVIISPKAIEELDEHITQVQDGLAIICNGNTHVAIENGHFAYVKNHPDLPDGLYQAKAAIAANEALSTSNLTADPSGGLNKLKEDVNALNSKIANMTTKIVMVHMAGKTIGTGFTVDLPTGYTYSNTFVVSAMYRVWDTDYNAFEKGSSVECSIYINSSNKMNVTPIGQYSVNGDLYVLISAQV